MTKVVILSAGMGTRLRPYSENKPKSMVELFGVPMLIRQLNVIENYLDKKNISAVIGYKSECLNGVVENLFYNPRYNETNMVYSLFCAKDFMDDDLIICYGDIIYENYVFEKLLQSDGDVSVVVDTGFYDLWSMRSDNPVEDTESLKIDSDGNLLELGKKIYSMDEPQGQYIGLIKVSKNYINNFISFYEEKKLKADDCSKFENMYMTDFIQSIIDSGVKVSAVTINKGWIEVDTVEDLEVYENLYKSGDINKFIKLSNE